ncbi:hypothetical protein KP509_1Z000800 [Ceratopteris richardii]|nr:hypothetical protein KP509_1Z000800 [Ceratopteris richardii]
MLCKKLSQSGIAIHNASDLFVVFISNAKKQVPLWCQKAGSSREDGIVIWDYHVICVQRKSSSEALVWDLDTTLGFPEAFSQYVAKTFRPWLELHPDFQRLYRVVAGPLFLKKFASDRRHMKTAEGSWIKQPPPYACICAQDGSTHNLEEYVRMSKETVMLNRASYEELSNLEPYGAVFTHKSLEDFFGARTSIENLFKI